MTFRATTLLRSAAYALLFGCLIAVFYFWLQGSGSLFGTQGGALIAFGRLAGLLTEYTILVQLMLIARIPWLEHAFGFDRMNKLHRFLGYSIAIIFIFHPLLLTLGYAKADEVGLMAQLFDFLKNWQDVFNAFLGACLFAVVIVSTVWLRKKIAYEVWRALHLLAYVAILLAFGHQTNTGDLASGAPLFRWTLLNYAVFGILVFFRALRPLWRSYRHRFTIESVREETHNIWSVVIGGKSIETFHFVPGQFAFFFFLQKGFIVPHPFSFSKAPHEDSLRITVKSSGDFSSRIKELRPGTKVIIDGPLGRFTPRIAKKKKFLFIAGGVGITPLRAMIESLHESADMILLYAARTPQDFALVHEIPEDVPVHKFVSETEDIPHGYEKGRISADALQRLTPDFKERSIYICGPDPMMEGIEKTLLDLGVSKKHLHMERFAF